MSKTLLTTTKYTTSNDFIPFFFFQNTFLVPYLFLQPLEAVTSLISHSFL